MKTLFIGGVKSGKSLNAQEYILKYAKEKPLYLATTEFMDDEMRQRVQTHKKQREGSFVTLEEGIKLYEKVKDTSSPILVECVSMWVNNMLYHKKSYECMEKEIELILNLEVDVVFVLNDVGSGVIADNRLAREFIDISGKLSQLIAKHCDEVYHCIAGIATKIK